MTNDSTLADVRPGNCTRTSIWGRRAGLTLLLIIVVAGAFGVFGVHSRTVTTQANGYTLKVLYPQTARAGLDVPVRFTVHHLGGFDQGITLAISTDYFRLFETKGCYPDADSS